ncbi:hypothetical protein IW261DRAFT_1324961 [Armillaria novae-zelandiae]|uniref:sn-1-specific diacylglycerol lipase n=1 Tax=Armillaria novae-zelandiae TaxID=153914 RepID=A0AA39PVF2_9AGAR|nr:hypothetical protein IW261DRAFT_1324961 [Armillaria novae-zelandiae]
MENWDSYGRNTLDLASSAASLGFSAVKAGTRLGFSVTRNVASAAVKVTTSVVDNTLFGGSDVTQPVVGGAVSSVISFAEQITLAPIFLTEYITSTSIIAAHSSINVFSVIFPGSSETSFSLVAVLALLKREWKELGYAGNLPEKQYGLTQIARGVIAWVALQGVTREWQEKRFFKSLREIHVRDPPRSIESLHARRGSRVRVTSDIIFPGNRAQIIAADIGEAPPRAQSAAHHRHKAARTKVSPQVFVEPKRLSNAALKATLRRLSKMVLAGYGGPTLLFFGVPLTPAGSLPAGSPQARSEEAQLARAINASEAEASGDLSEREVPSPLPDSYSWWDVMLGKHDQDIFSQFAKSPNELIQADVVIGQEHLMPRFWVLTDHGRRQVVLVIRGTMSLNEIAVDLTCDPEDFAPSRTIGSEDDETPIPGQFTFPTSPAEPPPPKYQVHSGILRMAKAMGDVGKPVQIAVQEALHRNPGYDLVICGHSLGAGVAALLGLMWADVRTCLTVRSSGLPVKRRVSVYCFAPPATTDVPLAKLSENLIVSFVYSHDIVSRLSIGTVKDLRNAAMWLCDANVAGGALRESGYAAVTDRANKWKAGMGSQDDPDWFIAMRKTLEANMQQPKKMFPPGRLLWALRDSDLHPTHRSEESSSGPDKLRLFEVLDVEKTFSQILFAKDMLSAHLPHKYDSVLHDLL